MERYQTDPALWEQRFAALGDRTPKELICSEGGPDFVFEDYITGAFGERMLDNLMAWAPFGETRQDDPALLAYWRERGVVKRVCRTGETHRDWAVYLPADLTYDRSYPLVFLNHATGRDFQEIEAWGFVQLAGREQFIAASVCDGNDTELVRRTVETVCALYPVDRSRVYLVGHSLSGNTAARIAVSWPELFSGLAMLGAHYYGMDSTPAELEHAAALGMPRVDIIGERERRSIPYNRQDPVPASPKILRNVTPPECSYEYACREQRMWRQINRMPPMDEERFRDIQKLSDDPAEQRIGMVFDRTEVRNLGGITHWLGDVHDGEGRPLLRMIGVQNAPHYPSAWAGALSWEFLRQFRRDPATKQIELTEETT